MPGKSVLIIGGGYLGSELARSLDTIADVTLIEPRESFVHSSAMIRGFTDPTVFEQALLPYDRLLQNGQVRRSRAERIDETSVTLNGGETLAGDIVVIATGSSYAAPFKPVGDDIDGLRQAHAEAHEQLLQSDHIAIIGGGAVGIELAGEIKVAMPAKSVTLLSDQKRLMPDYPDRLGTELRRKLELLGVDVVLEQRAEELARIDAPYAGAVTLEGGRAINSDMVVPVVGARSVSTLTANLPGARLGDDGRVLTDKWMRPSDLPNVFAAGDAAANGDAMTIVGTARQAPWLARTIKGLLSGREINSMPGYIPWRRAPILLPLGPHMGNSYLPFGVVGNTPTRLVKGRSLFIPKYRKQFGLN